MSKEMTINETIEEAVMNHDRLVEEIKMGDIFPHNLIKLPNYFNKAQKGYILEAIANHDRLVEENERLREALQWTHDKLITDGKRYSASTKRVAISKLLSELGG